jgi:hypothetical protein
MRFIKWYLKNSWFQLLVLLSGIIYMLTWEPQLDKTVGLISFVLILIILTVGKFIYWKKNKL